MRSDYQRLCTFLADSDRSTLRSTEVAELCARFNISPLEADLCFYSDFGMSGEEILSELLLL